MTVLILDSQLIVLQTALILDKHLIQFMTILILDSHSILFRVALVAAELASTYPKKGGIFRWVSEAFGTRWGFAAIYYQWQAIAIWFPTILIFGSVALAFIWWPETFVARLASNKLYIILTLLGIYWLATLNTFRGLKSSTKLSTLGGLFGTIIPAAMLIILGVIYLIMDQPIYLPLDQPFFPDFSNFDNLVLASSIFLYFGGMEMQAALTPSTRLCC